MKSTPIVENIYLGTCLRYLQDAKKGVLVHGEGKVLGNIQRFLDHLEINGLHVTMRTEAFYNLKEFQEKLEKYT